jgi:hypothetical protein
MKHLDRAGYGRPPREFGHGLRWSDAVTGWILAGTDDPKEAWTVGSTVPRGFESYLRIPHLAQTYDPAGGNNPEVSYLTWAQVAALEGTRMESASRFVDLVAREPHHGMPHPSEGYLDGGQCEALTEALRRRTADPHRCIFLYNSARGSMLPHVAQPFAARLRLVDHLGTEADLGAAC